MLQKFLSFLISSACSYLLIITQTANAANAELTFDCFKPSYEVGEYVMLELQEDLQTPSRSHRIDLWVAVQMPDGVFLFMNPNIFTPLSLKPQPFQKSLETTTRRHQILEFEVLEDLAGDYTFYALYVEEGKNAITDSFPVYRSNLATATITLPDQINPEANIPSREQTPCYNSSSPQPGEVFQDTLADGSLGPEMVVIPAGTFYMGTIRDEDLGTEKPVHQVSIASFAVGHYEITHAEYVRFLNAVKHRGPEGEPWFDTKAENENSHIIESSGHFEIETGYENHPLIYVSWYGVTAYANWLSEQTGKPYRLLSEAEWEYAARAGSTTQYWWGNEMDVNRANCYYLSCGDSFNGTAPVGSFAPNPFGLYDTVGNVWEWVADPRHLDYEGAPTDGSVWTEGGNSSFVVRGGSWDDHANMARVTFRFDFEPTLRFDDLGARLAR